MDMFGSAEHSSFPLNCLLTSGLQESLRKQKILQDFSHLSQRQEALAQFHFRQDNGMEAVMGWKP